MKIRVITYTQRRPQCFSIGIQENFCKYLPTQYTYEKFGDANSLSKRKKFDAQKNKNK